MKRALLIETATQKGLLALARDREVLWSQKFSLGLNRDVPILSLLQEGMALLGWGCSDLDLIVVGIGPGSYTGIRLGVSIAKVMGYSLDRPIVGVSSLAGYAPSGINGPFLALIDARQGGVYGLLGQKRGEEIEILKPPALLGLAEIEEEFSRVHHVVAPEIEGLKKKFEQVALFPALAFEERDPDPALYFREAREKEARGEICWDGNLPLLYLRKTQAEREREGGA